MRNALRQRPLGTLIAKQVADLIDARDARVGDGLTLVRPSKYWADAIENFAYVFELSDVSLNQIRRHTYHLTSDLYLRYYFGTKQDTELMLAKYAALRELTGSRSLAEPSGGIGYAHEDGLVSWDVLRYMSVIGDLLKAGVLNEQGSQTVVEIGGGYGGLCRATAKFNPHVRYTIIDLEETLFFSKSYLDRTLPGYDVRIVRQPSDLEFSERRIHLVPQHLAEDLDAEFDLAINHQSIQEMQVAQIERYLTFLSRHCRRFYSRNLRRQNLDIALRNGLSLDAQSQILSRFPEILWQHPADVDNGIDENLPRFVVNCIENNAQSNKMGQVAAKLTAAGSQFDEQPLHQGRMLDARPLPVGSSFVLTLGSDADVLALTFVTWKTTLRRLELSVFVRDAKQGVLQRLTVVCFGFRDWEEIVVDLRGIARTGDFALEFSVVAIDGDAQLGLPLFEPSATRTCRLRIGDSIDSEHVPAGRLLLPRR
jgi:putative sugar O-methyltransferase